MDGTDGGEPAGEGYRERRCVRAPAIAPVPPLPHAAFITIAAPCLHHACSASGAMET